MSTTTGTASGTAAYYGGPIRVQPWPSEGPLFATCTVISLLIWLLLTVSVIGLIYVLLIGLFFFVIHLAFVSHVRGSGVKLGPHQFPELYARVQDIGKRMGIERLPDAYIMQAGGSLNAFATRFLRSHLIVLYTDLLDACGDNQSARDMIIGHELGHIRAGHLSARWLILPAGLVPFLGSALSRAREFTCDRYGFASARDRQGALLGLAILAAGGKHGPLVNQQALVQQRQDLDTGWMTIGSWLSTHPPLASRLHALEPSLAAGRSVAGTGKVRAAGIVLLALLPFLAAGWLAVRFLGGRVAEVMEQAGRAAQQSSSYVPPDAATAAAQLQAAVDALAAAINADVAAGLALPSNLDEAIARWNAVKPGVPFPIDPYDGQTLGYSRTDVGYLLWSTGPDRRGDSPDDLVFRFDGQTGR